MTLPPYSNCPLKMPARITGVSVFPSCAPPHRKLKSERSPTPLPQLMNGPYSQLRALRTSATGFAAVSCVSAVAPSGDSAADLKLGVIKATINASRKIFAPEVKLLPFSGSKAQFSQERPAQPVGPRSRFLGGGSAGDLFHLLGCHIEVRVDVLRVVEVFQSLQQAEHLSYGRSFQLGISRCDHGDFIHHRGNACRLDGREHRIIRSRVCDDFPIVAFVVQVFAAMLKHDIHQFLFACRGLLNCDDTLLREHESHRARFAEVAAVL